MSDPTTEQLTLLRELRDGQREIIDLLKAQRQLAEEQVSSARLRVEESIGLQRQALARQRQVGLFAIPAILCCLAAIGYLVARYF
jgi:hypothetical protein